MSLQTAYEQITCAECGSSAVVKTLLDDTGGSRVPLPPGWRFFVCEGLSPGHVTVLYYCAMVCAELADRAVQRQRSGGTA